MPKKKGPKTVTPECVFTLDERQGITTTTFSIFRHDPKYIVEMRSFGEGWLQIEADREQLQRLAHAILDTFGVLRSRKRLTSWQKILGDE